MLRFAVALAVVVPTVAHAACWNPLGCKPETEAECIATASSAKTETAAKAIIQECRRISWVTKEQCGSAERSWAQYVASNRGVEWNYPNRSLKEECRAKFPATFSPSLWVDANYCKENSIRLARARAEVDATTLKSKRLEQARVKVPELDGMDDRHAIEIMQSVYYKDITQARLAAEVFIDAPQNPLQVADLCQSLLAPSKTR